MATTERGQPTAFVIMPFDEEFKPVYETLYHPVLEEAGFAVERADTHPDPTNIITKVIIKIYQSNLIIADLSEAKANVYYELGLANAMNKPVVMLINDISRLQFDVGEYHVIEYGNAATPRHDAHAKLRSVAERFLVNEAMFSSPYADALGVPVQVFRDQELSEHAEVTPEQDRRNNQGPNWADIEGVKSDATSNIETQLDDRPPQAARDEDQKTDVGLTTTVEVLDHLCEVSDQISENASAMGARLRAWVERAAFSTQTSHIFHDVKREPDDVAEIIKHMQRCHATLSQQVDQIDRILQYDMDFFMADLQQIFDDSDNARWQLEDVAKEINLAREHLQAAPSQLMQLQMSINQIQTKERFLARNTRALTRKIEQLERSFQRISQFISEIDTAANAAIAALNQRRWGQHTTIPWQSR